MLKWKSSEELKETAYLNILTQAKETVISSLQAAGFFAMWIFPMIGSVSNDNTGLDAFLKGTSVLFALIALFIVIIHLIPYWNIKQGNFLWLNSTIKERDKRTVLCENGILCEEIYGPLSAYLAGEKVLIIQMSGKNIAFINEKKKRVTRSVKKK